jgi:hypothetical protein
VSRLFWIIRSCFESIVFLSTTIFAHNYDFRTQL